MTPTTPVLVDETLSDILDHMKTFDRLLGVANFEDGVSGGLNTVTDPEGELIPYWVITFGNRGPTGMAARGIAGAATELARISFGVEVYARSATEVRRVTQDVITCLLGYEPIGGSEITLGLSGPVTNPLDVKQNHVRDGKGLVFTLLANTITVG